MQYILMEPVSYGLLFPVCKGCAPMVSLFYLFSSWFPSIHHLGLASVPAVTSWPAVFSAPGFPSLPPTHSPLCLAGYKNHPTKSRRTMLSSSNPYIKDPKLSMSGHLDKSPSLLSRPNAELRSQMRLLY